MLSKMVYHRVEVQTEWGHVTVSEVTVIEEDGAEISRSDASFRANQHVISPGQDYSGEPDQVQAIIAAVHTPEVIAAYRADMETKGNT